MFPAASRIDLFPSASFHERVWVAPFMPLNDCANPAAWEATYLPTFALRAVLPVPKRSYAAARRTDQSFQFGRFGIAGKSRAAMNVEAGADSAGTSALK